MWEPCHIARDEDVVADNGIGVEATTSGITADPKGPNGESGIEQPFRIADCPQRHDSYPDDMDWPARVRLGMAGALTEFAAAIDQGRPASPHADDILEVQRLLDQFYRYVGVIE